MERSLRSPKEIFSQAKRQEVAEISWQSQAAKPQRFLDFARNDKEGRCRNDMGGRVGEMTRRDRKEERGLPLWH